MKQFAIATGKDNTDLVNTISEAMKDGWQLHGSPYVQTVEVVSQAMIREAPDPVVYQLQNEKTAEAIGTALEGLVLFGATLKFGEQDFAVTRVDKEKKIAYLVPIEGAMRYIDEAGQFIGAGPTIETGTENFLFAGKSYRVVSIAGVVATLSEIKPAGDTAAAGATAPVPAAASPAGGTDGTNAAPAAGAITATTESAAAPAAQATEAATAAAPVAEAVADAVAATTAAPADPAADAAT